MAHADELPFRAEVRRDEDPAVVAFGGDLDLVATAQAEAALLDAQAPGTTVLLDLRELRFLDSSGLRLVLQAQRRAQDGHGRLLVAPGGGSVRRVLDLSGVAPLLELVDGPPGG